MMDKQFEAHYSKHSAWMFLVMAVIIPIALILSVIFWPVTIFWMRILLSIAFVTVMLVMFFTTIQKDGIAIEVMDGKLILHKKIPVEIPLTEITQITMNDGNGSFDMTIKTPASKYRMHCFVKEQRKKKDQFIVLMKNEGISLITFDYSAD
jgi:hypothetical protein